MIKRYYKEGEQLDVAGLNKITVLLDRSESEFTEVGHNVWRANLDGPPHKHEDKDQIFYITAGTGTIKLGDTAHKIQPGCLLYVPANLVHQTLTNNGESISYLLLNIFNTQHKEGHASFADHIEKVKLIRKQQAATQQSAVADTLEDTISQRKPKFLPNIQIGKTYEFGSNQSRLLIDRTETGRCELLVVIWPPHNKGAMVAHSEKEQSFFVLKGKGEITIDGETQSVKPGDFIYVPRNTPHTTETKDSELEYLCLNSQIDDLKDDSFEAMYQRIAPQRTKRWQTGSLEVGE